jgi:hypothetical protein
VQVPRGLTLMGVLFSLILASACEAALLVVRVTLAFGELSARSTEGGAGRRR